MKIINIIGAGVFLFSQNSNELRFLLLKNSDTNEWEPPKGIREVGESRLSTAFRELNEETGLKPTDIHLLPIPPKKVSYSITTNNSKAKKTVTYFIANLNNISSIDSIYISNEHSKYIWATVDICQELIHHQNIIELFLNISNEISHYYLCKNNSLNLCSFLKPYLKRKLRSKKLYSSYVIGSVASDELTVFKNNKILSDIDLIVYKEEGFTYKEKQDLYDNLYSDLKSEIHAKVDIGIFFFSEVDRHYTYDNIFWEFFLNRGELLSGANIDNKIRYIKPSNESFLYSIFRVIFYLLYKPLNTNNYIWEDIEFETYSLAKSILSSLSIYMSYSGQSFRGYENALNNLVHHLGNDGGPFPDESCETIFHAFAYKLSPRNEYQSYQWFSETKSFLKYLINWARNNILSLNNSDNDSTKILFNMILATYNTVFSESDSREFNNISTAIDLSDLFPYTLENQCFLSKRILLTTIWLLKWPHEVSHALFKFEKRMLNDALLINSNVHAEVERFIESYKKTRCYH